MSAGFVGPSSPIWQQPGNNTANLQKSAPPGYTYDVTKSKFVPVVGSAQNALETQQRGVEQQGTLFGKLSSAIDGLGGSNSSPTSGSPTPSMISLDGASASNGAIDTAADQANSAAFASAKSKAGAMARSSIDALHGEMASRGIAGSGTEGRGLVTRLAAATNPLADENNAELSGKLDIARHNQDLGAQAGQANLSAQVTQRGQDLQAEEARAQIANQRQQSLLALLNSAVGSIPKSSGLSY